jgi:H+/Cl- antiporter ClcA
MQSNDLPLRPQHADRRVVFIAALSILVGICGGFIAQALTRLIGFVTNIAFYHRVSSAFVSPADHKLGYWVVVVPVVGGVIVGIMARFGSKAIRGHGIPEAMEQVLTNRSRIPARLTILKPLSAAISIGTGGPFGAEGPIIATGGALGSLVGQWLDVSAMERKTLLAAGAAAGMAATFGCPVAAVLLAVELLLFEYRPRSLVPVSMAAAAATAVRFTFLGMAPIFAMPGLTQPGGAALATYIVIGAVVGFASVAVTRAVYAVEDQFEKLPIHWMWWPAIGGVAVGVIGLVSPRTMGVGYDNIENIISGHMATTGLVVLCTLKMISWMISLGSGTSGGTLAPLFTIGGGLGAALGALVIAVAPRLGVDVRIAGLVGMAAMFAGASRALLASVVFAFETTRQPIGLLPLLGGCCSAFLVSWLSMPTTIMTEKIVRRGVRVLGEYSADYLEQVVVRASGLRPVVTLRDDDATERIRGWLAAGGSHHQGFPVVDAQDKLVGVVTRRDLFDSGAVAVTVGELVRRPAIVIHDDSSLREAAERMAHARIGRLPVVSRADPHKVIGIVTRSDLVEANNGLIDQHRREAATRPRPRLSSFFTS